QALRGQRPAFALANEPPEPFPKTPRLCRDGIKLAGHRQLPQRLQRLGRHEPSLLQPGRQAVAIRDPVDRCIRRGGNRVEEVQAERVGDQQGGRVAASKLNNPSWRRPAHPHVTKITAPAALDKLHSPFITSLAYLMRLLVNDLQKERNMPLDHVSVVLVHGAWADGSSWRKVIG